MSQKLQAIRGMNDVLPEAAASWQYLHRTAADVFFAYGYREIRLPLVERTELFKRTIGDVTDIVEKEMYSFEDRGGEGLSLRPEGTAGCVRAGLQHGLFHNQQQRLWYAGPMFRYERPQAGRYRQFHQLGLEAYGMPGPDVDLELLQLTARLWRALGIAGLQLEINSLGNTGARAQYRQALLNYLRDHRQALDPDSQARLERNPLRVLDSKVPETQALLVDAPRLVDHLDAESAAEFAQIKGGLDSLGIDYLVNDRLVRGLDYYSKLVFEWTTTELGAQAAVCAGGRYDSLVEQLGGNPTPAVGFAIGVERLLLLMEKQAVSIPGDEPQVYLCWMGEGAQLAAAKLAEQLRDGLDGRSVVLHAGGGSFKSQMKKADRSGARWAVVLGEQELAQGSVQVKSLRESIPQREVAQAELVGLLQQSLGTAK